MCTGHKYSSFFFKKKKIVRPKQNSCSADADADADADAEMPIPRLPNGLISFKKEDCQNKMVRRKEYVHQIQKVSMRLISK